MKLLVNVVSLNRQILLFLSTKQPMELFYKQGVLKNSPKSIGKQRSATLLKKKLWHRYFPLNFPEISRTPLDYCFWIYIT